MQKLTATEGHTEYSPASSGSAVRHVRFVSAPAAGQERIATFKDPAPCVAVFDPSVAWGDLDILTVLGPPNEQLGWGDEPLKWVAESSAPGAPPPVAITIHGAQVIWGSTRAALLAPPERQELLMLALVDFAYHERELAKLEREAGGNWQLLDEDTPLACSVTPRDQDRFEDVGKRAGEALRRRARLARIVPHLNRARPHLTPLANQLADRLREKAHVEARIESLLGQFEAAERVYEMSCQRIADFTAARQSHILEWVIIVLLAVEVVLLLLDLLWAKGS